MIFTQNSTELNEILEAMRNAGVYQEYIEIGREYLDIDKPKNLDMLKNLKPIEVKRPTINGYDWEFDRKVSKYIMKNPELIKRFVQCCYAVAGSSCWRLFRDVFIGFNYEKEYLPLVKEALSELLGNVNADAVVLAIKTDKDKKYAGIEQNPEILLSAAELSMDLGVKELLCAYALDKSTEYNETTKKCIEIIGDIEKSGYHSSIGLHRVAVAECACFDDSYRPLFRELMENYSATFIRFVTEKFFKNDRIFKLVLDEHIQINESYINIMADWLNRYIFDYDKISREHLGQIAIRFENTYVSAMKNNLNEKIQLDLLGILREVRPEYNADDCGLRKRARQRYINHVWERMGKSQEIYDYITGKKSLDEVIGGFDKIKCSSYHDGNMYYYDAYGADDIVRKAVTAYSLIEDDSNYNYYYGMENVTGYRGHDKEFTDMLFIENAPVEFIINHSWASSLEGYAEKVAQADTSKLTLEGRYNYIAALSFCGDKYKKQIFSMVGDTSKKIRELLVQVISVMSGCETEIADMLSAKKANIRELALEVIAKIQNTDWNDVLRNALEKEKSEKLRTKILGLLDMEQQVQEKKEVSKTELVEKLTKGSKGKKVAWLFQSPYKTVHFIDGTDVPEKYMQALLICYADGEYPIGRQLAEKINSDELAVFAEDVLGRWIDAGAVAKNKWVLVFSAVNGKSDVISALVSNIKYWSENMRGALAVSAVKALALNGSSEALMQVDSMSRKYKSNQVKAAAKEALIDAADFLGITVDELSDRIVPDFDFDEKMCRVFDYGNRKFSVYLTPSLEIEIYNGDKKIKNLPKPSASDDSEIAEKSYADFKEMKKQLKSAVKLQTARLEYTLMCERKWTAQNWEKLFVKNPLMHCFAVGLIWGIYENGCLVSSFRYLDDGSFTTSDEEEFEIPENAEISLVHPVELSDDELSAWTEQLEDYEITQPFAQLARPIYRPELDELNDNTVRRFYGREVVNHTLASCMEKNGWSRGYAEDGGCFYEFLRCDISRKIKDSDGNSILVGYGAELSFSGEYIGVFQVDAEDVCIHNLYFYKADDMTKKIPVSEVSNRYFSEIIMQLTAML